MERRVDPERNRVSSMSIDLAVKPLISRNGNLIRPFQLAGKERETREVKIRRTYITPVTHIFGKRPREKYGSSFRRPWLMRSSMLTWSMLHAQGQGKDDGWQETEDARRQGAAAAPKNLHIGTLTSSPFLAASFPISFSGLSRRVSFLFHGTLPRKFWKPPATLFEGFLSLLLLRRRSVEKLRLTCDQFPGN